MGANTDIFAQLWKEYAKSDSRYLVSDPFVLCMETVTAVSARRRGLPVFVRLTKDQFLWGPLSFLVAGLIVTSHPLRNPLQAVVSIGQLYGDILYYATCLFDLYYKDLSYCRPEGYYFWVYFAFMNAIWIAIPGSECFDQPLTTC